MKSIHLDTAKIQELVRKNANCNVFPIAVEIEGDTLTAVGAFLKIKETSKNAFLLESVEGGERIARYSFMGADPFLKVVIQEQKIRIEKLKEAADLFADDLKNASDTNPLQSLQKICSIFKAPDVTGLPPFRGGAVGYLGYDCMRYLEKVPLPVRTPRNAFDAWDEAQVLFFQDVIALDRVKDRITLITNIFLRDERSSSTVDQRIQEAKNRLQTYLEILASTSKEEPKLFGSKTHDSKDLHEAAIWGRDAFIRAVGKVKEHIRAGDIFQCVISEQFEAPFAHDSFALYRALRHLLPAPYMFYLSMDEKVYLGASPETLVKASGDMIETCPIAGTRPRGKSEEEDAKMEAQLLASVKERAEHLMLVDLSRNDIGRIAKPGSVVAKDFMSVHRYSNVMHLVTRVLGKLKKSFTALDALLSCFPAGTLSGAPKIRAMQIIDQLEPFKRGPYGGAIVYLDFSGRLDSCICIRSAMIEKGKIRFQAGAGIVADSRADKEYDEVMQKSNSIRRAIEFVNRGE